MRSNRWSVLAVLCASLLITAGAAGDRWGRKLFFLIGFCLFGVACVLAATAQSPAQWQGRPAGIGFRFRMIG